MVIIPKPGKGQSEVHTFRPIILTQTMCKVSNKATARILQLKDLSLTLQYGGTKPTSATDTIKVIVS